MFDTVQQKVRKALKQVAAPTGRNVVDAGLLSHVDVTDGRARIIVELPEDMAEAPDLQAALEKAALSVPAVDAASVILTRHGGAPVTTASGTGPAPEGIRLQSAPKAPARPRAATPLSLPDIGAIVAVASGKGGVGKSTVAVNLALALAARGQRVGLLDADIYGPSIPQMLAITDKPEMGAKGEKLKPVQTHGLTVMSIGLLVDTDTPMIWRGPMVMSALSQMLGDVDWGPLDILVVDMPPGTGDTQLTMAQRVALAGAVIVSTPQEVALIDARKAIAMFRRTQVPILGVVENMAWFSPPGATERHYLFGEGGARRTAQALGCPFLGEVPLYPTIGEGSDAGRPVVATAPDGREAQPFLAMADAVRDGLAGARRPAPHIVWED